MRISDEIRVWCDRKCGCYIDGDVRDELYALADRIDRETVELPKDADGEVIHVMDTLYDVNSGSQMQVRSMTIDRSWMITTDVWCTYAPSTVTHTRPDSLERIADELDEWRVAASCDCRIKAIDEDIVHDLAERIRKLAKEDGE
jgi:hypothetical protein